MFIESDKVLHLMYTAISRKKSNVRKSKSLMTITAGSKTEIFLVKFWSTNYSPPKKKQFDQNTETPQSLTLQGVSCLIHF
ncbi:hypothetical protein, partial [Heyndrickxia coagulans]|uniref:hypothetical protein n=1 Tax=Heyndrickxia coagulans TaxID=1398 RepID=UPI00048B71A3